MRTFRALLAATTLFVFGLIPQMVNACIVTYWDHAEDYAAAEIDAWAYVDDSFNVGYCAQLVYQWGYFEHTYDASVYIESPTQRTAFDADSQSSVPFGGGSAYAMATLSFAEDLGEYTIQFQVSIWCTLGGDVLFAFGYSDGEETTVRVPECDLEQTDLAAVGVALMWPQEEPWERGVMIFCATAPSTFTFGYYGDSFGLFYGGAGDTNDPCQVSYPATVAPNLAAIMHSHPWFDDLDEYQEGNGCLGDQKYHSQGEINIYNTVTNVAASNGDKALSSLKGVPMYTRAPSGSEVRRYWPPAPGPSEQLVYP